LTASGEVGQRTQPEVPDKSESPHRFRTNFHILTSLTIALFNDILYPTLAIKLSNIND
jgi:hypothetical protein